MEQTTSEITPPADTENQKLSITIPPAATSASLKEFADALLRKMDITKGIRFESHRRLVQRHVVSHLAISTLSIYVICIALLEVLVTKDTTLIHFLFPLATIIAPIFILVMEKHLAGEEYLVMADRM